MCTIVLPQPQSWCGIFPQLPQCPNASPSIAFRPLSGPGDYWSFFCCDRFDFLFLGFHVNNNTVLFVELLSGSIMILRFKSAVAAIGNSFTLIQSILLNKRSNLFICCPVDELSCSCQFGFNMNEAVMNICVQVFVWLYAVISSG